MATSTDSQPQHWFRSPVELLSPLQRGLLPWMYLALSEGLPTVEHLSAEPVSPQDFNHLGTVIRQLCAQSQGTDWSHYHRLRDFALALAGPNLSDQEREQLLQVEDQLTMLGASVPSELYPRGAPPHSSPEPKRFNPRHLRKMLAGPRADQREAMFAQLEQPRFRHEYGLSSQIFRERVFNWCLEFAHQGLGGMAYPVEVGGGGDLLGFLSSVEAMAHFDLSLVIKFGVHFGLFCGSVYYLGSQRHHEAILPAGLKLELPGCFAMTETGHGSNVRALETTATFDRQKQEFIIHTPNLAARKDYIGNAAIHARMATVFAQLVIDQQSFGVHAFLVPIRDLAGAALPGVHIEDCGEKVGLHGVDNGRLRFTQVRIPRDNLLDRFAQVSADGNYSSAITSPTKRFFSMISTLVLGRVCLTAAATSCSKNALSIALRYGEQRRQFGAEGSPEQSILDYQSHQRRLLPRLASTLALAFAYQDLALGCVDSRDSEEGARRVESLAAGLKAWGTWHAFETVQICRECCGGQGYLATNRLGALRNDLDVFLTFEGDNTVLMQLVAKSLLTEYRHQFSEMGLMGLLHYLSRRASQAVAAWNPLVSRNTDPAHLCDADFQVGALRTREEHHLSRVAARLKHLIESGQESWAAFNRCQDHLVTLAQAHVERHLYESFQAAVQRCSDTSTQAVLSLFCSLFGLTLLENDRAFFLETGHFEGSKSKAIRKQFLELCQQTRPLAWDIISAFAIPDKLLAAPIALGDFPTPPASSRD